MILSAGIALAFCLVVFFVYKSKSLQITKQEIRAGGFGILFFLVALLPFILIPGLYGTYSYLPTLGVLLLLMLFVKRVYSYLETQGRDIAYGSLFVLLFSFSLFHIIQFQDSLLSWRTNGEKVRSFYVSIDDLYSNNWSTGHINLVFIRVPVGGTDSLILPRTLADVLWFAFQNPNLKTTSYKSRDQAVTEAKKNSSTRVFQFRDDGSIEEILIPRT